MPDANIIVVPDTLAALQALAAWRRRQFSIPVIGITGSNGKTTVKEWLNQLLAADYHIVRSPKSYNSQIGVPLSVWQLEPAHELAIFEAGISRHGPRWRNWKPSSNPPSASLPISARRIAKGSTAWPRRRRRSYNLFEGDGRAGLLQ
jgi:DNA helicase HerA-like ATPase